MLLNKKKETTSEGWILTFAGKIFRPLAPRAEDICIEDIAHALSNMCRFNGHVSEFYSVAQHSVQVAKHTPAPFKLHALLHDASEAYIFDVPKPIKDKFFLFSLGKYLRYSVVEASIERVIFDKFDVKDYNYPVVKSYDIMAICTEVRDLMGSSVRAAQISNYPVLNQDIRCFEETIVPLSPKEAEAEFLKMFRELTK